MGISYSYILTKTKERRQSCPVQSCPNAKAKKVAVRWRLYMPVLQDQYIQRKCKREEEEEEKSHHHYHPNGQFHRPPHPTLINKSSPFLVGVNLGTQTGLFNPCSSCSTSLPTLISFISSRFLRSLSDVGTLSLLPLRTFNGRMMGGDCSSYIAGLEGHIPLCVRDLRSIFDRGVVDHDSVLLLRMCVRVRGGGDVNGSLRTGRETTATSFGALSFSGTRVSRSNGARSLCRFCNK
jgi:hypothetical protein